ncbi:MAG TPA: ATP-binding cassette domain-containing protein [Methylomirabilota bacterium]|nr:ATP-binding cassette domain-containing protein [Methylomirabilota bacterium]
MGAILAGFSLDRHAQLCDLQVSRRLSSVPRHAITSGMSDSAIILDSLEKWFPPALSGWRAFLQPFTPPTTPALRGITLEVKQGEAVALLGANGAGKTTLLRILATLLLPTRGSALLAGHDTARESAAVRQQIGYHAGSDLGLYSRLTGRQNLLFFGRLNHLSDEFSASRIQTLSERFGLLGVLDRQARALSSGTIQRFSLIRALLHQPKVLLLDEPTRSLDAIAAADFRHFLKMEVLAQKETSLLFASHTMQEIELIADRVAILDEGKLLAFDTPNALRARTLSSTLEEAFARLTGRKLYSGGESTPE